MSRAEQLDLMVSLTTSVTLQEERDRAIDYAHDEYNRAQALAEENDGLKARLLEVQAALQAEQARNLQLQRELLHAESMAESWRALAERWRDTELATPRPTLSKDVLNHLIRLCHPDKWSQGQPATKLAHEIMVRLNQLREGGQA